MFCKKFDCEYHGKQNCKLKITNSKRFGDVQLTCDRLTIQTLPDETTKKVEDSLNALELAKLILQKEFKYGNFLPAEQVQLAIHLMK